MAFSTLPTFAVERARASKLTALATAISELRPLYAVKTADTARANNTLADDPHLSIAGAANTVYELDGLLRYTCASGTPDFQVQLAVPAGATYGFAPIGASTALAAQVGTSSWYSPSSGAIFLGSNDNVSFPAFARLHAWVSIAGTAGNVKLQWSQVATNANAVTLLTGSFMTLRQLV